MRKHGMTNTPEYTSWEQMKNRCDNPRGRYFAHYGGRGIKVCERWRQFANFYEDMGSRPGPGYSLDRIDVNGDYGPGNCRWATSTTQQRNRTNNVHYELHGLKGTLRELCELTGAGYATAKSRIGYGAPIEVAVRRGRIPRGTIRQNGELVAL